MLRIERTWRNAGDWPWSWLRVCPGRRNEAFAESRGRISQATATQWLALQAESGKAVTRDGALGTVNISQASVDKYVIALKCREKG
jgi:hypothetical protein